MSTSKNYGTFTQWNTMHQKEGSPNFMTAWIELENIMLSETSQSVRDEYHMISLITGI